MLEIDLADSKLGRIKEPDIVFHLAAQPGVRASWGKSFSYYLRDNILASQRLLDISKKWNLDRFIYASSSSVYGNSESYPTKESDVPSPTSPYGATKLAGEHLCDIYNRNFGVPTVILRYFTVYGPRQRPDMAFSTFIERLKSGTEITLFGNGHQERDFTFVEDVVKGTLSAARADTGETYNLGTGKPTELIRVIRMLESLTGKKAKLRLGSEAKGDAKKTCADISKFNRKVGYRPKTTLEDGIRMQLEYKSGPAREN